MNCRDFTEHAKVSLLWKQNGSIMDIKDLIFFCHHSSAHKCQISLSLDCTVSDYLI